MLGLASTNFLKGVYQLKILARRGHESLAFGPMRPVGLTDPRTGRRPYAVVQLRQDNLAGTLFNMVGFQTNLKFPEQKRVFRTIPGLEKAEFVRTLALLFIPRSSLSIRRWRRSRGNHPQRSTDHVVQDRPPAPRFDPAPRHSPNRV